ncbi:hypothetical protein ABT112_33660 [Streptomyces sp. NPDC002055]|uniref:hypothetical protein n=1 Tax=Streptomyces sp. NPDC002055 TaxID=3154534 RepID=UPI00332BF5B8
MPRKRPGRVRTKHTNRRAPLLLSTMAPEDFNVRPGETKTIACPDCRTWRRIMGDKVLKIREHCISDKVAEGEKHTLCPGSNQLVDINIDVQRWQAKQNRLLRDAMPQENRRAARQFYKPLPAPAAPVSRMSAAAKSPVVRLPALLEAADAAVAAHRGSCQVCTAGGRCEMGAELEARQAETAASAQFAREQRQRQERQAERRPASRAREWRATAAAVRKADTRRAQVPAGDAPTEGTEVPLAPQDVEAHERRQAELGKRYARTNLTTSVA